ncbi:MAG: rhodanese-like domain-containing protein [Acidobacteriota bacterium]|nr:rhodanese-like domain-containing protein [Acidobacteriota bacterium]
MAAEPEYRNIDGDELYRRLATGEPIMVLDVRTETEFAASHIPGSLLIPLHQLEQRRDEVPNSGTPVAIVCQHGQRSESACRFLSEHGHRPLFNLTGGMEAWPGPTDNGLGDNGSSHRVIAPARFLVENFDLLPKGVALDLAMGEGRNAIYLATRGFDVDGVDVDPEAVARARVKSRQLGTPIRAVVGNVEDGTYIVPLDAYDVVVVLNYLHRPLFNDIRGGLRPGGVVVYQTFTTGQLELGHGPTNPDYLLGPGELKQVFDDWEILKYREYVEYEGPGNPPRALAGIVARKPEGSA